MKFLFYMDPFVDVAEDSFVDRSYVLRYELMPGSLKRQLKKGDELLVLCLKELLELNELERIFRRDKIPHSTIAKEEITSFLSKVKGSIKDFIRESLTEAQKKNVFEFISKKIGNFKPDIILGWGMVPSYLQELFPAALILECEHSAFSRIVGEADFIATPKGEKDLKKLEQYILNQNTEEVVQNQKKIGSCLKRLIEFPEKVNINEFKSNNGHTYFYPGHFPSVYSVKFSDLDDDLESLHFILSNIDNGAKIYYTKHPLYKTKKNPALDAFVTNCDSISDLSKYDFDEFLSLRAIEATDCVINSHSKTIYLAIALNKKIVEIGNFFTKRFLEDNSWEISSTVANIKQIKLLSWHINTRVTHGLLNAGAYRIFLNELYDFYRNEEREKYPIFTTVEELENTLNYAVLQLVPKKLRRDPTNYEKIKFFAFDEHIDNLCVDIFDTLLVRPVNKPTDLFYYMTSQVSDIVHSEKFDFFYARINSEWIANQEAASKNCEDATFDEIYNVFERTFCISKKQKELLKQLEVEWERKLLKSRKSMLALVNLFKLWEKKVYAVSDMYFAKETVAGFLEGCGYPSIDKVIISSDEGVTKKSGLLYKKIIEKYHIDPTKSIFVGDNYESDVLNSARYGFNSFHYPKAIECFDKNVRHDAYYPLQKQHTISSYLAVIANTLFDNPFVEFDNKTYANNKFWILGYVYFGPFLGAFAAWLEHSIDNNDDNDKKILFCSRDCLLIKQIFDLLSDHRYSTEYLYLSRSSTLPLFRERMNAPLLVDKYNSHYNSNEFIEKYFEKRTRLSGIKNSDLLTRQEKARFAKDIATNFFELVDDDKRTEEVRTICSYLRQVTEGKEFVLVDSGARGTSRDAISDLFEKAINLYLLREYKYKRSNKNRIHSWHKESFNYFRQGRQAFISNFYEPIISACCEASCKGYIQEGAVIRPIVDLKDYDQTQKNILMIQKGTLQFCKDLVANFAALSTEVLLEPSVEFFKAPIEAFHSRQGEVHLFEHLYASNDMSSTNQFSLLMPALPVRQPSPGLKISNSKEIKYRKAQPMEKKIDSVLKKFKTLPVLKVFVEKVRQAYVNRYMKIS